MQVKETSQVTFLLKGAVTYRDLQRGDLVRITPLYYEKIQDESSGSQVFWETVPIAVDRFGRIKRFVTSWGRVGTRGQSMEHNFISAADSIDDVIMTKVREGYVQKERPSSRDPVQIEGLRIEDVVRFPTAFLAVVRTTDDLKDDVSDDRQLSLYTCRQPNRQGRSSSGPDDQSSTQEKRL